MLKYEQHGQSPSSIPQGIRMVTIDYSAFPDIFRYAKAHGVRPEILVKMYAIEHEFRERILAEPDFNKRKKLYASVYNEIHRLKQEGGSGCEEANGGVPNVLVDMFAQEFRGGSILDVGCGTGHLLKSVARKFPTTKLVGIDISQIHLPVATVDIRFVHTDILDFDLHERFDVVVSENVFEHIAPADVPLHLASIRRHLVPGGKFILYFPNRLFGPSDISGIIDYSSSNRIPGSATHLNESTYWQTVDLLREHGFSSFYTVTHSMSVLRRLRAPNVRVSPALFVFLERSDPLLKLIYKIRVAGKPLFKFSVALVCAI